MTTSTTFLRFCGALLILCTTALLARGQELPRRVYVGIDLQGVNDSIQRRYNLPDKKGILVRGVRAQSSAQAAGLQPNDIILQMGTTAVGAEVGEFIGQLKQYEVGDKRPFTA
ncbi:MAG TPA: PDZ domain-containing protein [Hymenobacter sp.]|nr:PDZ domain-containing protein [Hymenobacter sp.]